MENVLEKAYKKWRETQEDFILFDNQNVIIDSGEEAAREDFFDLYLDVENLSDDTKFEIMLGLEQDYEKKYGTLDFEKCKLAINEMVTGTNLSVEEIVKDVIQRASRSNEIAEKNMELYSDELNDYTKNFKKLYLSPDFNTVSKEIEILTETGSFKTNDIENIEKELDNLKKAGYECYYDNDRIHLENWTDPHIEFEDESFQKKAKEYFNSIQDPWDQKLANEKKGLARD